MKEVIKVATYKNALKMMFGRRDIILFSGLITLFFTFVGYFNPLSALLYNAGDFSVESLLDSVISLVQLSAGFLSSWDRALGSALAILVLAAVLSIAAGFVLSGYFSVINNAVMGREMTKGEFVSGLKKNFRKIGVVTFKVMVFGLLFIVVMIVAAVPAIVITSAWLSGKSGLLLSALFLSLLTGCVLFFSLLFFRTYIYFWYPAAFNAEKNLFAKGKKVADLSFWKFAARITAIDMGVFLLQFLFAYIQRLADQQAVVCAVAGGLLFLLNWAVGTVLFASLMIYTFSLYRENQMKVSS